MTPRPAVARWLWAVPAVLVIAYAVVEPPSITRVTALAAAYVIVLSLVVLRRRLRSQHEDDRGLMLDLDELAVVALALVADPVLAGAVYGAMALWPPGGRWYRTLYTVAVRVLVGLSAALLGQLVVPTSVESDIERYLLLVAAAAVVHLVLTVGSTLAVTVAIWVETGGVPGDWYSVTRSDGALAAMAIPLGAVGADLLERAPYGALVLGVAVAGSAIALTRLLAAEMAVRDEQHRREVLLGRLAELADVERRELVREVHDGPLQQLILTRMLLESIRPTDAGAASAEGGVPRDALDEVDAQLGESVSELRRALSGSGSSIVIHGLGAAIESLVATAVVPDAISVRVTDELPAGFGAPGTPDDRTAEVVLACVRELLNNALKHAGAGEIVIELGVSERELVACVIDDGAGFDADVVLPRRERDGHLGIPLVRERLDRIGGRLEFGGTVGEGARATCRAPLAGSHDS